MRIYLEREILCYSEYFVAVIFINPFIHAAEQCERIVYASH